MSEMHPPKSFKVLRNINSEKKYVVQISRPALMLI